jgi:tRNA U34 5-carboxymethylaminomethyl modifying GTPase MnmE/TrmE
MVITLGANHEIAFYLPTVDDLLAGIEVSLDFPEEEIENAEEENLDIITSLVYYIVAVA